MFEVDVNGLTQQYRTKPTMNIDITGSSGSIPKPLTYDYMPEGYPKMVEFTGMLMEERSVNVEELMTNPLVLIEGKTYTVNFDGTDYNCVCYRHEMIEEGATEPDSIIFYIGNPTGLGIQGETSEPFVYAYIISNSADNYTQGIWICYDDTKSHTVSVQGTGLKAITILPSFLPTGDGSPYEVKQVGIKRVYVAQYDKKNSSSDKIEALYNEVNTAWSNGYYVLLYVLYGEFDDNPEIYNLFDASYGTYCFSRINTDINNAPSIETYRMYNSVGRHELYHKVYNPYYPDIKANAPSSLYLKSSASNKVFSITVDDSGTLSATELT